MVIDGKPGKPYDGIRAPYYRPLKGEAVFFGDDRHYAYIARTGDGDASTERMVVDGMEELAYHFIFTTKGGSYLNPLTENWMYVGWPKDGDLKLVVDGKVGVSVPFIAADKSLLLINGHSMWTDFESNTDKPYVAVVDGKRGKSYGFITQESLTLHSTGAYGYEACDKIGEKYFFVINGKESARYVTVLGKSLAFSNDGTRHAFWANKNFEAKDYAIVVDGKEYPVPYITFGIAFSPSGRHWMSSCLSPEPGKTTRYLVVDGKVVGDCFDKEAEDIRGLVFSTDETRYAYLVQKDGQSFVVLDDARLPSYHAVHDFTFSPDGTRWAYVAKRAAGEGICRHRWQRGRGIRPDRWQENGVQC